MDGRLRRRFWVEAGMAVMTALLTVLTIISREWIEVVFGVDPDGGSGTLELALVAAGFSATAVCSVMARVEWTRRRPANALEG